jgi:hypothetical protein
MVNPKQGISLTHKETFFVSPKNGKHKPEGECNTSRVCYGLGIIWELDHASRDSGAMIPHNRHGLSPLEMAGEKAKLDPLMTWCWWECSDQILHLSGCHVQISLAFAHR